jgi:hypothetical protein
MKTSLPQTSRYEDHGGECGENPQEGACAPKGKSGGKAGGHPKYLALAAAMVLPESHPILRGKVKMLVRSHIEAVVALAPDLVGRLR